MIKIILVGAVVLINMVVGWTLFGFSNSEGVTNIFILALLGSTVLQAFLNYYMWNAINDGKSSINPTLAAVLSLLPVFNYIWTIAVFTIYPRAFNKYIDRRRKQEKSFKASHIKSMPFNYYIFLSIAMLFISFLPIIGILVALAGLIAYLGVIITTRDAIEELNKFSRKVELNKPLQTSKIVG